MHAFLIVGNNSATKKKTHELVAKLNGDLIEFPLQKIEDLRNLENLVKLSFNKHKIILSKDIHLATIETLNAFLKNLEEPQENLTYILTATSEKKVLPTIISRVQVIKVASPEKDFNFEEGEAFFDSDIAEKFRVIDKIKLREDSIKFMENLISTLHNKVHSEKDNKKVSGNADIAINTWNNLKHNGNISLQLTNFVISIS